MRKVTKLKRFPDVVLDCQPGEGGIHRFFAIGAGDNQSTHCRHFTVSTFSMNDSQAALSQGFSGLGFDLTRRDDALFCMERRTRRADEHPPVVGQYESPPPRSGSM
jgi:hypothetical protein